MNSYPNETMRLMGERHSKRAFLSEPVPRAEVEAVLAAAASAPSSKNSQPWGVVALDGDARDELSRRICAKFDRGEVDGAEYQYGPEPSPPWYDRHAKALGYALFELKGIDRRDLAARREHDRQNYLFFGAPLLLVLHLPADAERGTFLDLGLFLANVILGFESLGLGSCPQASLARYAATIRDFTGLAADRIVVCGLAVGRPDAAARVNAFTPSREPVAAFTRWMP